MRSGNIITLTLLIFFLLINVSYAGQPLITSCSLENPLTGQSVTFFFNQESVEDDHFNIDTLKINHTAQSEPIVIRMHGNADSGQFKILWKLNEDKRDFEDTNETIPISSHSFPITIPIIIDEIVNHYKLDCSRMSLSNHFVHVLRNSR